MDPRVPVPKAQPACQAQPCGQVATMEVVDDTGRVRGRYCLDHGCDAAQRLKPATL